MKVERTIEDIEFGESHLDELRKRVKHELIDDGGEITDEKVERRLKEMVLEIGRNRTKEAQGHNDLHLKALQLINLGF